MRLLALIALALAGCAGNARSENPATCARDDHACHVAHPEAAPAGCAPTDHACHERD